MVNILFDIDDTLFPSTEFSALARKNALTAMIRTGIDLDYETLRTELQSVIKEKGSNYQYHFSDLCLRLKIKQPARYVAAAVAAYHDTKTSIQPYPKVPSTLQKLKEQGHKLFVATHGSSIKQWDKLIRLGIARYFDDVFVTEDFQTNKDEIFFRKIIERLGADASQCVMLGDREALDIKPAKAVGMKTIRILQGKEKDIPSAADHTINKIEEILDIMQHF